MKGPEMFAARSAMLVLALNLLISPAALCGSSGESPGKDRFITSCHFDRSAAGLVVLRLPHSTTVCRFTPWKARPKIVLGATDSQFAEEDDLGPVPLPRGHISPGSIDSTTFRLPAPCPLRC
jgi:hypothetical protein